MEFLFLLVATLLASVTTATIVVLSFRNPVDRIFGRIIGEEIALAWRKFLTFALFVVGVSSGVRVWKLEEFIAPASPDKPRPVLSPEYWGLEIYRTIIDTLGGLAWALFLFFIFSLIAFVIVKVREGAKPTA